MCFQLFEIATTLVAPRPGDAFNDLTANSIVGVILLSITVKIAFWIFLSTGSTILFICLSILSSKHLSKVTTFTKISLVAKLLQELLTVRSWSTTLSLTTTFFCLSLTALPVIIFQSMSSNWLRRLLFDCLFLRVESTFALTDQLYLKWKQ